MYTTLYTRDVSTIILDTYRIPIEFIYYHYHCCHNTFAQAVRFISGYSSSYHSSITDHTSTDTIEITHDSDTDVTVTVRVRVRMTVTVIVIIYEFNRYSVCI